MDIATSFKILGNGLSVQRARMDTVSSNLANVNTTRTPEGGAYRRRIPVIAAEPLESKFDETLKGALQSVKVESVVEDNAPGKQIHQPGHPDADASGMVTLPNVNVIHEMADMITASRSYEACVTAFDATKNMALKALEIGK